jgi:hypothetical protein
MRDNQFQCFTEADKLLAKERRKKNKKMKEERIARTKLLRVNPYNLRPKPDIDLTLASQNVVEETDDDENKHNPSSSEPEEINELKRKKKGEEPEESEEINQPRPVTQKKKKKEPSHVWVMNVGLPNWSGEDIVDHIMNGEKKVVYIPQMKHCFNQWIAQREIHELVSGIHHGRVRCVIQLLATPLEDPRWFKTEWGWDPATKWKAYEVGEKKFLFEHVKLTQSIQGGKPWKLFQGDQYLAETSKLLTVLVKGTTIQGVQQVVSPKNTRQQQRQATSEEKANNRQSISYYSKFSPKKKQIFLLCCTRNCADEFGCTKLNQQYVPLMQFVRQKFHSLSRESQRVFISHRITNKNTSLGVTTTVCRLDPVSTLQYYCKQGWLPLQIACEHSQLIRVCRNFFNWLLHISNNKLDQPSIPGPFSIDMSGPRARWFDHGAKDSIEKWLTFYAEGHLHDPSKEARIILSAPNRIIVYQQYKEDFENDKLYFFPQRPQKSGGDYFLPSLAYFMKCWRTSPHLKKIVLRKYLKFALCDQCIYYREQRRILTSVEEKQAIRKQETIHRNFVNEERQTYYWRRHQSIYFSDDYVSIVLDGAAQQAYGLPHLLDKDKQTSGDIKMPLFLMGALVHGFNAYLFTYLRNIKHGTNIVIECLHHIFCHILSIKKHIPPVVFLQLDNTSKQNKNQFMIGWLSCLVAWGVVRKVVISFLPVGHTHEDPGINSNCVGFFSLMFVLVLFIAHFELVLFFLFFSMFVSLLNNNFLDQLFSKTAGYLRTHDATDRDGVLESIKQGFTPNWSNHEMKPYVRNLDRAADISGWLRNYLAKLPNLTEFRQFEIEMDSEGQVVVRARQRCVDDEVYNKWSSLQGRVDEATKVFGCFSLLIVFVVLET